MIVGVFVFSFHFLFVCVCLFVFLPALSIDKTFHCDREINEADKRQQIFECQTSYTHKPVREKPRREENDVQYGAYLRCQTRTDITVQNSF